LVSLLATSGTWHRAPWLRTADAAGADAVIFADASVDIYNGKCVRASAGSLFHLPSWPAAPA